MWRTGIAMAAVVFSVAAVAEQSKTFGDYVVHYNAFNSSSLSPEIAKRYGLIRGANQGVVNIVVLNKGDGRDKAAVAKVEGSVRNLLSQRANLSFKEVRDGEAIYYLAGYRFDDQDTLVFDLQLTPEGANPLQLEFNQLMHVH